MNNRFLPNDNDAAEFIERIDELLESGDYDWAEDTLNGIRAPWSGLAG